MSKVSIIVAADDFLGIGLKGKLPWDNPQDLANFKRLTTGGIVVMGYNTWTSLPPKSRPLLNRINYVLSRQFKTPRMLGVEVFGFNNILDILDNADCNYSSRPIFIIGGAQVYKLALDLDIVDKIIMTRINGWHSADTFFPPLPNKYHYVWNRHLDHRHQNWERFIYTKQNVVAKQTP